MINPFEVLGVHRKSTDKEIQLAFYELAREYHPDVHTEGAAVFQDVNKAYQLIKDKKRRHAFFGKILNAPECPKCRGAGATSRTRKMTEKEYHQCGTCGGAGVIIKQEENENVVIKLRGTTGAGRKGSDKKR